MISATMPKEYKTLVFDCDGVILDSNRIKTEAFAHVAMKFGINAADQLVRFHVQNGGVSRYRKFEYLLVNILHRASDVKVIEDLAKEYGQRVCEQLLLCPMTQGLHELRNATSHTNWMVVSGGDQAELHYIFDQRGLTPHFNRGIYGSPATKDEILDRLILSGHLEMPALFLGDSRYDHEAAKRAGLDFIFIHEWTEFKSWQDYCVKNDIPVINRISELYKYPEFPKNDL
jgi:phosphoglycolate phosphatase-like HAD superfamily hydrolase